jgi:hypothetical protein
MRWVAVVVWCNGVAMERSYLGSLRLDLTGTSEGTVNLTHVVDLWELLDDLKGDVGCLWVANRDQSLSLVQSWLKIDGEKDGESFVRRASELGGKMGVLTLAQVVVGRPSRRVHAKTTRVHAKARALSVRLINQSDSCRLGKSHLITCIHLIKISRQHQSLILNCSHNS